MDAKKNNIYIYVTVDCSTVVNLIKNDVKINFEINQENEMCC